MKLIGILLVLLGSVPAVWAGGQGQVLPELVTVARVELPRYLGRWYEIASIPQSFQRGCTATTAEYTLKAPGEVTVVNTCNLNSLDGKIKKAEGRAWIADPASGSKLKVSFFWPFAGDYWIFGLAPDYSYALVGAPGRDYLWILSRTPTISSALYKELVEKAAAAHFDVSLLHRTWQPGFVSTPSP